MGSHVLKIRDWYYYRRRVPTYVRHLDQRQEIRVSLSTKNRNDAIVKADIFNEHIESYWKSLIKNDSSDTSSHRYKAAVQLAKARGFAYKTATELSKAPLDEIIERLGTNIKNKQDAEALLGGVNVPVITLLDCDILYWDLTIDRIQGKTNHKISKWKNPRKAALKNFISVVGNKPIEDVNRTDILDFKQWWRGNIAQGKSPSTANKQLQQVKDIIRTVANHTNINIEVDSLFANISFRYSVQSRPPFEAKFVQNVLIPKLGELNERDRLAVLAMAVTGARETEIFGLNETDIKLEEEIPFIWIRPRKSYSLKTATSERKIPLVGTALFAFQQYPSGFILKGNPDTFSNIVNNYLTDKNLRPTPRHSIYSLRHTFKDV